jgi:antitoxin component of MazEF toxin-antitoxin module
MVVQLVPDGHGGAFLPIPDAILTALGWVIGDEIAIARQGPSLVLQKAAAQGATLPHTPPEP